MITKGRSYSGNPLSLTLAYVKERCGIATLISKAAYNAAGISICTLEGGEKNFMLTREKFDSAKLD